MPRPNLGPEYPAYLNLPGGERLPLLREKRWSREYGTEQAVTIISRFMDGSASIALEELRAEWPRWDRSERLEFGLNCDWLDGQADFADQLRFIVSNGGDEDWSAIAQKIAMRLPSEEAFATLESLLARTPHGGRGNIVQAIARVGHPGAAAVVLGEVRTLLANEEVWADDTFVNPFAFELTCAIAYAVGLGADHAEFESTARRLAAHPCKMNVDVARTRLGPIYVGLFPGRD